MKFTIKYAMIALTAVAAFVSCKKEEPFTFTSLPSFNFVVEETSAPLGFIADDRMTIEVEVALIGNLLSEDMVLRLDAAGDARPDVDFILPEQVLFPKGAVTTTFEVAILKASDIDDFEEAKTLVLSFSETGEHVPGTRPETRIQIDGDVPTQWIGHNFWFDFYFVPCTKARYRYLYKKLGFVDFSEHPGFNTSAYEMLQATSAYLNQQIALDNELLGEGNHLKDDDGTDLTF